MMDLQVRLEQLQQQVRWIDRELHYLRTQITQVTPSADPLPTFESLRGVWQGVVFNEEDFQASRWQLPREL